MNKLLTVVVPVYNTEKYLAKCLDSLIVTNYMDKLEILVVIDGSPDHSAEVAKEYVRKYPETFKVIEKENGGHGSAINKGLELATGIYFRVLDSDDWFDQINFKQYLDRLSTATEDVVLTHVIKEYPSISRSVLLIDKNIEHDKTYTDFSIINNKRADFLAMSKCAYRTSILKENGLCLLEKRSFEDTFLHIFPIPYIKSFICYDIDIYHYYLERPNQSVKQKVTLKHVRDWRALVQQMMTFYDYNKNNLTDAKENFIIRTINFYIDLVIEFSNSLPYNEAYNELKSLDALLSTKSYLDKVRGKARQRYIKFPFFVFRSLSKSLSCAKRIASFFLYKIREPRSILYV